MEQTRNYRRFFALLRTMTIHGDREECRRQLVLQYTAGRTDSLREMNDREYSRMCDRLESMGSDREELKQRRSAALRQMQKLGVDTTDWGAVNRFCGNPRIAGCEFGRLDADQLAELTVKLRAIRRKGWQREKRGERVKITEERQKAPEKIDITFIMAGNGRTDNKYN